jgi:hypothetical protein
MMDTGTEFVKEHAVVRDKSGKVIRCPRDTKSAFELSETVN